MVKWPRIIGLALLSSGALLLAPARELPAATSAGSDIMLDRATDTGDVGSLKPLPNRKPDEARPLPGGNPLWSVPLSALTAMRERPIFSASRRPPQRAVVAAPAERVNAPAPAAAPPDRPTLALIGVVVGEGDAIALFLDSAGQKIVRLRQGDVHAGWVLTSVLRREVTLEKAGRSEVLSLPRGDRPAGAAAPPAVPGLVLPASGAGTSYAPFTPRSTPKNGEPDGL